MLVDQRVLESYRMAFALSFQFGLDGDFLLLMAAPPASLIGGFVDGDAIDPCTQAGVAVEAANAAKNLEKDFLGEVEASAELRTVRAISE